MLQAKDKGDTVGNEINKKLTVKVYRVAQARTSDFRGIAGANIDIPFETVVSKIKSEHGRFGDGFSLFYRDEQITLAAQEVLGFNLEAPGDIPVAGIVNTDPLDFVEMHRLDGQLRGELLRLGIATEPDHYSWRCAYEMK